MMPPNTYTTVTLAHRHQQRVLPLHTGPNGSGPARIAGAGRWSHHTAPIAARGRTERGLEGREGDMEGREAVLTGVVGLADGDGVRPHAHHRLHDAAERHRHQPQGRQGGRE